MSDIDFNDPTLKALTGPQRDAYAALVSLFKAYGLQTLTPVILKYLQNGFSADTITVLLQQTSEYKTRFSGNEARKNAGLAVLTPAEYLSTEAAYSQILRASGLDPSWRNTPQFAEWIGMDISPAELQDRTNMAVSATLSAPPGDLAAFLKLGFNPQDIAGFFLNDKNPTPGLHLKLAQAQIMGAGIAQGLEPGDMGIGGKESNYDRYGEYAKMGVTYEQAQLAYQQIAHAVPRADELQNIYGLFAGNEEMPSSLPEFNQRTLEEEFLGKSGEASLARETYSRHEIANFSGGAAVNEKSFTQPTTGQAA